MGVRIDHVAIPARQPEAAAAFLADILGLAPAVPDGADGDMFNLQLADGSSLLVAFDPEVHRQHMAFRVSAAEFRDIVSRLAARSTTFGNDPENPENGETSDPLGGEGRVYFTDPNGHLFEVAA